MKEKPVRGMSVTFIMEYPLWLEFTGQLALDRKTKKDVLNEAARRYLAEAKQ